MDTGKSFKVDNGTSSAEQDMIYSSAINKFIYYNINLQCCVTCACRVEVSNCNRMKIYGKLYLTRYNVMFCLFDKSRVVGELVNKTII